MTIIHQQPVGAKQMLGYHLRFSLHNICIGMNVYTNVFL